MNPPSFNEKCSKFFKVFKSSEEAQDMIKSNCSPLYLSKLFFLPINSEPYLLCTNANLIKLELIWLQVIKTGFLSKSVKLQRLLRQMCLSKERRRLLCIQSPDRCTALYIACL